MSDIAIRVDNLGKRYRLGQQRSGYKTLREAIAWRGTLLRQRLTSLRGQASSQAGNEDFWALQDVSFEVKHGEVIGIIGRNGAGKSTLLKILSRITEPTQGRVELHGRIGSLLEVGTGFHPELTGRENIYMNGAILGMKKVEIDRKFDEIVAFAEIEQFLDTPVKRYSSGMYVRLAFAVAAHLEPEILLVDEVLAVGDAQFQKKCLGKMGDVARGGRTVLFVSHNLSSIQRLCHSSILLASGAITGLGSTHDIIKQYLHSEAISSETSFIAPQGTSIPGYVLNVITCDIDSNPQISYAVGQPWKVVVRFLARERIDNFMLCLGMRADNDVPLRVSWTQSITIAKGVYEAVFTEDTVVMAGGRYIFSIGLSSFEKTFQYIESACSIEFGSVSFGDSYVRLTGVGAILNPFKMELHRVGENHEEVV